MENSNANQAERVLSIFDVAPVVPGYDEAATIARDTAARKNYTRRENEFKQFKNLIRNQKIDSEVGRAAR